MNSSSIHLHKMSALDIVQTMNSEDERVAESVKQSLPEIAEAFVFLHITGQMKVGLGEILHAIGDQCTKETRVFIELDAAVELPCVFLLR